VTRDIWGFLGLDFGFSWVSFWLGSLVWSQSLITLFCQLMIEFCFCNQLYSKTTVQDPSKGIKKKSTMHDKPQGNLICNSTLWLTQQFTVLSIRVRERGGEIVRVLRLFPAANTKSIKQSIEPELINPWNALESSCEWKQMNRDLVLEKIAVFKYNFGFQMIFRQSTL